MSRLVLAHPVRSRPAWRVLERRGKHNDATRNPMKRTAVPDFAGRFLSVSMIGSQQAFAMDCPHFEMQGGRWFLIGNVPTGVSKGDWREGAQTAVAWDQVSSYLVFESAADYVSHVARFRESKQKA